jgi:protease-4
MDFQQNDPPQYSGGEPPGHPQPGPPEPPRTGPPEPPQAPAPEPPRTGPPEPPRLGPPEPPRAIPPYPAYPAPPRRTSGWRIFWGVLFGLSVLANLGLFLLLLGVIAFAATGRSGMYQELVLRQGPRDSKIVRINVGGILDGQQAEEVYQQIRTARRDRTVKGIIVQVNSPGGTISASDRIHREIRDYRREEGQPAVAFMQGVAASGGYYASVACDEIVAEPTALTGSIGVIMAHFVFEDLLENKLGIQPVFMTMGQKKDWPSSFRMPTEEERSYIQDRLLEPAYNRFVDVVKEGRQRALTPDEVEKLADGSIFVADKALEVKLIDKIGYLDDAIARVKAKAGIEKAQVVEYHRPFSFASLLSAKGVSIPRLDRTKLFELSTPQVLYLWNAY